MALRNKDESFANLVGVRSIQRPSLNRVQPNDAGTSYLIQKLENAAGILGGRMPLGGDPLNADQISAIRDWIETGALIN